MNIFSRLFASKPKSLPKINTIAREIAVDQMAAINALAKAEDPDEALKKAGLSRDKLRVLEYDDEISAALETRREAVLATPWRIEPAPDSGRVGRRAAEAVWENLEPMMPDIIRSAWDAVPYGYSVIECMYFTGESGVMLERATGKPFEWFEPRNDGTLMFRQSAGDAQEVDTRFKFFLTRRAPSYRQPYGEALLSRLYWPWYMRQEGWKLWARYLERHGSPMLVGRIDVPQPDRPLTQAEHEAMNEYIRKATDELAAALDRATRSATVATTADISAISPGNAGEAFEAFNKEIDKRIQKVILGQTLTTDVDGRGSYAAARVHENVRKDKRDADLRMVAGTVQRIVNALADLNGWPRPVFDWMLESELEIARAERDAILANANIVRFSKDYLLRVYDFEENDIIVNEQQATPVQASLEGPRTFAARLEAPQVFTAAQQAVEDQVSEALRLAGQPIDPNLFKVAIMGATSEDDLKERLSVLMDQQDPGFADLMAKAQFAANVLGYINAEEGRA